MEEHIDALLVAELSFQFAWGKLGDGVALPRAVLTRMSGAGDFSLDGPGPVEGRLQVDCYGQDFGQALDASREVKTALNGYRGGPVLGMFLVAQRDDNDADTELLQRVSLTFSVTYRD